MNDTFATLGVAQDITRKLAELGFSVPTPIQAQAITPAIQGRDVIGIAQTGTGKTFAFGIPLIEQIAKLRGNGQGLIILPTRELAEQVEVAMLSIGRSFGLRTALLIGGTSMGRQVLALKRKPHVIIGTPGRIVDHLEQRILNLSGVTMLILDEADRMLDMGFAPQVNAILDKVPKTRQTLLFSATMPQAIERIAATQLRNPIRVQIASATGPAAAGVSQSLYVLGRDQKAPLLAKLLADCPGPVLVFSRTKHGARKLRDVIARFGEKAAEIHGNRSLPQRREALAGFKAHRYHVLVATDVAARGIDVSGIELVINYDLPDQPEDYIHRIGRTGRAGLVGRAISFATPDQQQLVRAIERLTRNQIPRATLPTNLPSVPAAPAGSYQPAPRQHWGQQRGQRSPRRPDASYRSGQQPTQAPRATSEFNDAKDFYQPFVNERAVQSDQWSGERRDDRARRPFQGRRNQRYQSRSRA